MNIQAFVVWFKLQLVVKGLIPEFVNTAVGVLDDREFDQYSFLDNKAVHISRDGQSVTAYIDGELKIKRGNEEVKPGELIVYSKPKQGTNHAVFWTSYTNYASREGIPTADEIQRPKACSVCRSRFLSTAGFEEFIPSEHVKK